LDGGTPIRHCFISSITSLAGERIKSGKSAKEHHHNTFWLLTHSSQFYLTAAHSYNIQSEIQFRIKIVARYAWQEGSFLLM
jgi:hypothetical protein